MTTVSRALRMAVMAISVAFYLLVQSSGIAVAEPSFDRLPVTCIAQIPDGVRITLNEEIAARIRSTPLSLETTRTLKDAVSALDEGKPATNAEHRKKIIEAGAKRLSEERGWEEECRLPPVAAICRPPNAAGNASGVLPHEKTGP